MGFNSAFKGLNNTNAVDHMNVHKRNSLLVLLDEFQQ